MLAKLKLIKFSKILMIMFLLLFGILFTTLNAIAHAPSYIELEYDFSAQKLNVTITHNSPTPNTHYIKNVEIWINDQLKLTQNYTSQPSTSSFTYSYNLSTIDSDLIKVTASCNLFGDITDELTVVDPTVKKFSVIVQPEILELGEEEEHFFNIEVQYNDQLVENVTLDAVPIYGIITWEVQVPNEPYLFKYVSPDVSGDADEIINITISKTGFQTEYVEFGFVILDLNNQVKKDMVLELSPIITELNENEDKSFELTITSESQSISQVSLSIVADIGGLSEVTEPSIGSYQFINLGAQVESDTVETITITAKKPGYNDGKLNVQFTVLNLVKTDPRQTLDGKISSNEYKFSIELDDEYFLHWRVQGSRIKMAMEAKTTGWVSIGFDPSTRMKDADMIFGWVTDSGAVFILDTYSQGETGPHPPDGSDDITAFGGSENSGKTIIEFERELDTDDFEDKKIPKDDDLKILWAIGVDDDFTSQHTKRGAGTINTGTGEYQANFGLWLFHAIFMTLGLVFVIVGNCIARALQKKRWWLKVHRVLGTLGTVFGILGLILAIIMVESAGTDHLRVPHAILGIITIILLVKTPILGVVILKSGSIKKSKNIRTYHRWIGRITGLLMVINVVMGLMLMGII